MIDSGNGKKKTIEKIRKIPNTTQNISTNKYCYNSVLIFAFWVLAKLEIFLMMVNIYFYWQFKFLATLNRTIYGHFPSPACKNTSLVYF